MTFRPHSGEPIPAPAGEFSQITRTIFCKYSGLPLANLSLLILEGYLPYLGEHEESLYIHPLYRLSSTVLIRKLEDALHQAQGNGWILIDSEQTRLRLLVSTIMHSFGCIKQDRPSLPSIAVAAGSAGRLLGLAKWFYYLTSQRMTFPIYSVSARNQNLEWENFKIWLDSAYQVRQEWANTARELKRQDELKSREAALVEIKSEHIRRVDLNKIWRWIEIQLEAAIPKGRLVTWKELFLQGDINPSDWLADDLDDLQIEIAEHCDNGNEVMFFIQTRLNSIREIIKDFYSGFTLIGGKTDTSALSDQGQTAQEKEFLSPFEESLNNLTELPPQPVRSDYDTMGKFIKASAEWSIIAKLWKQRQARKEKENGSES